MFSSTTTTTTTSVMTLTVKEQRLATSQHFWIVPIEYAMEKVIKCQQHVAMAIAKELIDVVWMIGHWGGDVKDVDLLTIRPSSWIIMNLFV